MNSLLVQNKLLLTGQSSPHTGESVDISRFKETAFTAYTNGNGSVSLQYKSPFFENDWVDFYSFENMTSGYALPAYLTTPITEVRAISSGNGQFWCGLTAQN